MSNIVWVVKIAKILSEVCYDSKIEPTLAPLSGEDLSNRTTNRSNETRLDVWAHGFWERVQEAFFDLRVFDPNACRYLNKSLQQCHVINENEKKREYSKRVLQVDHGTFTPLAFSIYGSMGRGCQKFYSRLSDLLSEKRNLPKLVVTNWVRSKSLFSVVKVKPSLFTWLTNRILENIGTRMWCWHFSWSF